MGGPGSSGLPSVLPQHNRGICLCLLDRRAVDSRPLRAVSSACWTAPTSERRRPSVHRWSRRHLARPRPRVLVASDPQGGERCTRTPTPGWRGLGRFALALSPSSNVVVYRVELLASICRSCNSVDTSRLGAYGVVGRSRMGASRLARIAGAASVVVSLLIAESSEVRIPTRTRYRAASRRWWPPRRPG